jgi:chromatin remodeling complex protein RSC6
MNHKKYQMPPAKKSVAVPEPVAPVPTTNVTPVKEVAKKTGGATKKTDKPADKPVDKPADKPVDKKVAEPTPVAPDAIATIKNDVSGGEVIITGLLEKVSNMSTQLKTIQTSLKQLVKEFDKQKKIIDKVQKKREKAKKSPSGFAKPCKISDELCDFIGIPKGTEQSRTDITRYINSYVKQHNLNNPENRREFFPDKKLKTILNVKDGEKVTYFVLQRLIAHHFPPSMSKLAAAAKAAA